MESMQTTTAAASASSEKKTPATRLNKMLELITIIITIITETITITVKCMALFCSLSSECCEWFLSERKKKCVCVCGNWVLSLCLKWKSLTCVSCISFFFSLKKDITSNHFVRRRSFFAIVFISILISFHFSFFSSVVFVLLYFLYAVVIWYCQLCSLDFLLKYDRFLWVGSEKVGIVFFPFLFAIIKRTIKTFQTHMQHHRQSQSIWKRKCI